MEDRNRVEGLTEKMVKALSEAGANQEEMLSALALTASIVFRSCFEVEKMGKIETAPTSELLAAWIMTVSLHVRKHLPDVAKSAAELLKNQFGGMQ